MKKLTRWKLSKKRMAAMGAALGIAFSDFDPTIPPSKYKQIVIVEAKSEDEEPDNNMEIDLPAPVKRDFP